MPVGSSANRIAGSQAKARAIATRCCSPPDNCRGVCVRRSPKPTRCKSSRARASAFWRPASSSGNITFSRAVRAGNN
ncbi:hypothetical protein MELB17_15412 [Marinobacter sp. ELB17]|nr:hypothetical protein MELB17_15412 [Marinobacter sp. ELB17]